MCCLTDKQAQVVQFRNLSRKRTRETQLKGQPRVKVNTGKQPVSSSSYMQTYLPNKYTRNAHSSLGKETEGWPTIRSSGRYS